MNPFKYGSIVSGNDFCSRQDLVVQIAGHIKAAQNIVVLGERRIGKTSLIFEAAKKVSKHKVLYIDFLGIKSTDMLCKRILRAAFLFEKKERWVSHMLRKLAHLRPVFSVDPITTLPTLSLDSSIEIKAESIAQILDMIKSIHDDQSLVVVFDEFQDVLKIPDANVALSLLRGKIQFHNDMPYIFAGSIRTKMAHIFTDSSSAFFKSAIPITIGPIDKNEFGFFLMKKFETTERKIADAALARIFTISENITGDIQQLCSAVWEISRPGTIIDERCVIEAVKLIFSREEKSYEHVLGLLSKLQYQCLLALSEFGGAKISSNHFVKACGSANPSSVRKAVFRLVDYNVLFESEGEFRFVNPFFRAWIVFRG
jgi:uncharacterized protein